MSFQDPSFWYMREKPPGGVRFSTRHKGRRTRLSFVARDGGDVRRRWHASGHSEFAALSEQDQKSLRGEP